MKRVRILLLMTILLTAIAREEFSQNVEPPSPVESKTRVVLLGTGTPNADPDRSGPSVAIVVNDTPYIIDFGPGVVRRAAAAHHLESGAPQGSRRNTRSRWAVRELTSSSAAAERALG